MLTADVTEDEENVFLRDHGEVAYPLCLMHSG